MAISPADAATLLVNRETAPGTASTGAKSWLTLEPNPGGITGLKAALESVSRNPLSKNLTDEAGDIVGLSVSPQIVHDLNKDLADFYAGDWFRCDATHPSPSGQSLFRISAVVDGGGGEDSFTVAADGDVGNGTLVRARGCTDAANNAVFVTTGTPTDTAVKVATGTLVAETPPANATLDVVGFQGASGDITMEADGDLACTTGDFTTHGLVAGMWIKIGDGDVTDRSFAVAALNGWAQIDPARAITANLLPLRRHSFTPAANAGTAKLIRILTPRFYRNYPLDHAKHDRATSQLELEVASIGTADASSFRYGEGLAVGMVDVDAPLKNKIVITTTFVGMDVPDPVLAASRPADTATAVAPLAVRMFDTSSDMKWIKVARASNNAALVDEINSWKLSLNLNVKPQEIQGVLGANGHIHAKFRPSLSVDAYHTTDEATKVVRSNADVTFIAIVANEDGGMAWDVPGAKLRNDEESFAEGDAVMLKVDVPAHRETASGIAAGLSVFGYVPTT